MGGYVQSSAACGELVAADFAGSRGVWRLPAGRVGEFTPWVAEDFVIDFQLDLAFGDPPGPGAVHRMQLARRAEDEDRGA